MISLFKGHVPPSSTVSNLANRSPYFGAMMIIGGNVFAANEQQLHFKMVPVPLRNVESIKDTIFNHQRSK